MLSLDAEVEFAEQPYAVTDTDDALFAGLLKEPGALTPAARAASRPNYSHDAMIDMIVADPGVTQNQIAASLGYSVGWVSQVIGSDAFQAKLAARAAEFRDPVLVAAVELQFKGILLQGLEKTRERLAAETVSDNFLLRSTELAARSLGYGAKRDEAPKSGTEDKLVDLASNLVGLLRKGKRDSVTFEGDFA